MKALEFSRSETKYAAAAISSRLRPGSGAQAGPLELIDARPPSIPGPGWHRVKTRLAGICGSDLATVDGQSARYFEPWVSFPFVPGHEVVGTMEDGSRVVLEPVLGHQARGVEPPFADAAPGAGHDYRHLVGGSVEPGIQIGYCASTGGGWSTEFVAHESQLHPIASSLSDEAPLIREPARRGVHAAMKARVTPGSTDAVLGRGTTGLDTVAAVRRFT
ncbi:MAG: alcohol dehydrogenase catalytic domain-containing protein, partial [Actinomycetia bacterium]|nr:alcohol dehydrogenase catalytic domain-containing protein [Actinomycetes bacterium]